MFNNLPPSAFEVYPVKLTYLNENRDFYGDFTLSGSDQHFQTQSELSGISDFSLNYDSVNFLTETRTRFSTNRTSSSLVSYTENLPELNCPSNIAILNYWVSLPHDGYRYTDDYCLGLTNLIPLKNPFNGLHKVSCNKLFRSYTTFNFGNNGFDHYKPQLNFTSQYQTRTVGAGVNRFKFKIPDWSQPITPTNFIDFNCFGAIASDCPLFSDNIIWFDDNETTPTITWLKGDGCSGMWVDRYIDTNDRIFDIAPSELTLISGVEYEYKRPSSDGLANADNISDDVLFSFGCVDGSNVLDLSSNENNGFII